MNDNETYHALPGVSNSMLSVLAKDKGPQLFDVYFLSKTLKQPTSDAMDAGELVHCLTLEPDAFWDRYATMPQGLDRVRKAGEIAWKCFESNANIEDQYVLALTREKRTNEGKSAHATYDEWAGDREHISCDDWNQAVVWLGQLEANRGKKIIKLDDYATALACADALRGHDQIGPILAIENAMIEKPLFFELDGVDCRCKPDWVSLDHALIVDVKTTQDASPKGFARSAADYGYYRQAAFYRKAVELLTGIECRFLFACVETTEPYAVACYEPDADMLRVGMADIMSLLAEYRYRFESGDWLQDWSRGIVPLALPTWHKVRDQR